MNSSPETTDKKPCCRRWLIPVKIIAIILVKSVIAFFLWNALVPELFHGPQLSFLQTVGLLILAKIIFGHGGPGRHCHRHHGGWHRWHSLTPEEREKLKAEMKERCST